MTHRQRAIAAIRGEPVDQIPFIAPMDLWYNHNLHRGTLPEKYRGWSLWDIQRDLDIGIFGFGAWSVKYYKLVYHNIQVLNHVDGLEETTEYVTPYGRLRSRNLLSEELKDADVTGMQVEHEFKDERDYDALQFLFENTEVVENYDEYSKVVEGIGEDGVALPFAGWVPMHYLMHHYYGYEPFYYELADHATRVEKLHEALLEQYREIIKLGAHSPAEVIEVGANYVEAMTPPGIFEQYMLPIHQESARVLHRAGKLVASHPDGDMRRLLKLVVESGIDVGEAITPVPMTSIDVRSTRDLWKGRLAMWGGIPAVLLTETYTDDEFERYVLDLFDAVSPGDRFILGFGDNAPTDALFNRIAKTADLSKRYGSYPMASPIAIVA